MLPSVWKKPNNANLASAHIYVPPEGHGPPSKGKWHGAVMCLLHHKCKSVSFKVCSSLVSFRRMAIFTGAVTAVAHCTCMLRYVLIAA